MTASYANFFQNVDVTVDYDSWVNPTPRVLRSIVIKGFPLNVIPVVEIVNAKGVVVNYSRRGNLAKFSVPSPGVICYTVNEKLHGDFAIHGYISSTLVWKYQDTTCKCFRLLYFMYN